MESLTAPLFLYTIAMLASALGGFAISLAPLVFKCADSFKSMKTLQRLGEAHCAGLFLGVALCHMLDSALDHYASFKKTYDVQTDYPVVPLLVGLTFAMMIVLEACTGHHKQADCPASTPPALSPTPSSSRGNCKSDSCQSDADKRKQQHHHQHHHHHHHHPSASGESTGLTAGFALTLALLFTITTPLALVISAAWGINQDDLLSFVVQSIACGTFLYLDFEAVAAMRGHGIQHSCVQVHANHGWKATLAIILMSCHAIFDGFAISTSTGSRAGVICFAITIHKFWVAIALGSELQKAIPKAKKGRKKMANETDPLLEMKDTRLSVGKDKNATDEDPAAALGSRNRMAAAADCAVFLLGFGMLAAVAVVM